MRRLLLVLFVLALFPGTSLAYPVGTTTNGSHHQVESLQVALIIPSNSEIKDGGFNEIAWNGLLLAKLRLDARVTFAQPIDPSDTMTLIDTLVQDGHQVIVTVGFTLAEATIEAAQIYPDVHFIGVDQFQAEPLDNLTGLIFPEDQAGFLAGVLAASLTQTGVVASVLGTPQVPSIVAFDEGFKSGVRWTALRLGLDDIDVISTFHPGDVYVAFSEPAWGASTAAAALAQDADVVFAAAGLTGNGALEEVAFSVDNSGRSLYCIGVDTDQWVTVPSARSCLVSSSLKLIKEGVYDLIKAYRDGTITGGNFLGDVGLAEFHDFEDQVSEATKALIQEVESKLRTGALLTCYGLDLSDLKIGLVTDVGEIDDAGFNESAWNGVLAAGYCGADVSYIETQDAADFADNIAEFAESDTDIVVTVGSVLHDATRESARAYPEVRFIALDQWQDEPTSGVTGLVFDEQQSGFLAGYLAAQLSETDTIAAVLGSDQVPSVVAFADGFAAGARHAKPDITIISTYHPGGLDVAFVDPQWGAATARQALDQSADVVFAAAGKTGSGALIEVASAAADGNPPYCIGADTDQWLTIPESRPCLVTSAIKVIDGGIAQLIVDHVNGTIQDGNYWGDVGLAPFHDFDDWISAELEQQIASLAEDLAAGRMMIE